MAVSAISTWIDAADRAIWPQKTNVDNTTLAHYFFSPFPKGLNKDETAQWCQLQIEVLAPFPNSYHYCYKSHKGLHLWFATSPFNGTPETASHNPLADGKHHIRSDKFDYIEQWQDGIMRSCIAMRTSESSSDTFKPFKSAHYGWATERKLIKAVSSPMVWAGLSCLIFVCAMLFIVSSYVSTSVQLQTLETKSEELSELVGPKLSEQTTLAAYVNSVNYIRSEQTSTQFLPESFSLALSAIPQNNASVNIESVSWQNDRMDIAIKSDDIDITQMIQNAESISAIQSANIRPEGNENTWVFEVQF